MFSLHYRNLVSLSLAGNENDVLGCEAECCVTQHNEPYQPRRTFNESKKKQGKQSRTFQKSWFDHHRWLTYCTTRNRVFCFYCRKVKLQGGLTFREHEKSQCHREACMKYEASNKPSVVVLADRALKKEQDTRRTMLLKQLSSLRFLMRQGLGHSDIEGNLHQIMRCRAEDIPKFHQWLEAGKYQSPEIVNEQIQLMAHCVLRSVLDDIRSQSYYSLIVDETRDVSGKEQLAISLRWVNSSYEIFEDLIGLVEVERTDASSLKSVIKRYPYPLQHSIRQLSRPSI